MFRPLCRAQSTSDRCENERLRTAEPQRRRFCVRLRHQALIEKRYVSGGMYKTAATRFWRYDNAEPVDLGRKVLRLPSRW